MRKCREILKGKLKKKRSHREVAACLGVSPGSVGSVMERAAQCGLNSWKDIKDLSEQELEALLYPPASGNAVRPEPDPAWIHTERQKRRDVTLELLHLEYLRDHPRGYKYTAFCERYRRWLEQHKLSMRQVHRVGEKTFVDYSGDKASVIDPKSGEIREAEIFVATLGASSYTYVEATWTQQLPDWTASHVRMCEFFGGVTEMWIPDQLRSGVSTPDRYDPEVNRTYADLAEHYDTTVFPARPRRPKDKAKVESAVLLAQRWILARLRNETFFSLAALNTRIRELVVELNDRPMKAYGNQTRRERYELLDHPALQPLPSQRYVYADWCKATVRRDYHVNVDGHWYSVPYQLVGKVLEIRYSAATVEVFHRDQRVASHRRSHAKGEATTLKEHMPKGHRVYADLSGACLLERAAKIGPMTEQLIADVLETHRHPEQAYRISLGILTLAKDFGEERLEAAATRAMACGIRSSRQLKTLLRKGLDRLGTADIVPEKPVTLIDHENIRGPLYYH